MFVNNLPMCHHYCFNCGKRAGLIEANCINIVLLHEMQVFSRIFSLVSQSLPTPRHLGAWCLYWLQCWTLTSPPSSTPCPPLPLQHHHRYVHPSPLVDYAADGWFTGCELYIGQWTSGSKRYNSCESLQPTFALPFTALLYWSHSLTRRGLATRVLLMLTNVFSPLQDEKTTDNSLVGFWPLTWWALNFDGIFCSCIIPVWAHWEHTECPAVGFRDSSQPLLYWR